jgi:hypothetical protein
VRTDHIVSTMAVANQLGVISLGALWWGSSYTTDQLRETAAVEFIRQADFLSMAWNEQDDELLLGIGDGVNTTSDSLLMYSDFGVAMNALAIGPRPEEDPFGPFTTVKPTCSHATPDAPAVEVAAHAAAALALAAKAVPEFSTIGKEKATMYITKAESLLKFSIAKAPLDGTKAQAALVTDPKKRPKYGVCCQYD